jgi:hypothetical protein
MKIGQLWNESEDLQLRKMYAEGFTASQIACGIGRTRAAVIGRWDRLGLNGSSMHDTRHASERKRPMATKRKPDRKAGPIQLWPGPTAPYVPFVARKDIVVEPLHIGIMELTSSTCRWPYGEANFTYCGRHVEWGSTLPYCHEHVRIATNK